MWICFIPPQRHVPVRFKMCIFNILKRLILSYFNVLMMNTTIAGQFLKSDPGKKILSTCNEL